MPSFVSTGACVFERDCFNISTNLKAYKTKKAKYQKLKPFTNTKDLVKKCNQFLLQNYQEGGNFRLCLGGKPYFVK